MTGKPAKGVKGFVMTASIGTLSQQFFRVYEKDGSFKDYPLLHSDLEVTIESEDAWLYENRLDHSPKTLGKD